MKNEEMKVKDRLDRIKKLLKEQGMTQTELAKRMGIQQQNLNAKLRGRRTLTYMDAIRLGRVFNKEWTWFMMDDEETGYIYVVRCEKCKYSRYIKEYNGLFCAVNNVLMSTDKNGYCYKGDEKALTRKSVNANIEKETE